MSLTLVHLSDIHFGAHVALDQVRDLEEFVPNLKPNAVVVSGDLTQRARHGEFQRALRFVDGLRESCPVLVVPGNHDTEWWKSPFGLLGKGVRHRKYLKYFGSELGPVVEIPGAILVGTLSSHGLDLGSVTWNPRDLTVKGHLPASETARAESHFRAGPECLRVLALHHNVLRGEISHRMGLAHWRDAHKRLVSCGADLVLCGHDHQESVGQLDGRVVVAASGTHTSMSRGGRPSAFNVITADANLIAVRQHRWDRETGRFIPGTEARYARPLRRT